MAISAITGTYCNLINAGSGSVGVTGIVGGATTYVVNDIYGNLIASGSVSSGASVAISAPNGTWTPGWFFCQFSLSGTVTDSLQITALRANPNFISIPPFPGGGLAATTANNAGDPGRSFFDVYMHGILAMGPLRYAINDLGAPNTVTGNGIGITINAIAANVALEQAGGGYLNPIYADAERPRPPFVSVGPVTEYTSLSGYSASVTSCVASVVHVTNSASISADIVFFEGLNEPAGSFGLNAATSALQYDNFATGVHAASVGGLAMGPCEVTFSPVGSNNSFLPNNNNLANWLNDITVPLDAFSQHFYNGYNGDIVVTDAWLNATWLTLQAAGYAIWTLPFWVTELGAIESTWSTYVPRRINQWMAQVLLTLEQWGCPKEHIFFETDSDGGQSLTSWMKDFEGPQSPGELRPNAVVYRILSEEVYGKAFSSTLNFGPIGNNFYKGSIYAGSGGKSIAVLAQGNPSDVITLNVSDRGTLTCSDWQGNLSTVTVEPNGNAVIPITDLPTYVRLSASCVVSVTDIGNGVRFSKNLAPNATALAGTGAASVSLINDGIYQTGGYLPLPDSVYTSNTLSDYVELDWGASVTLNKVMIRQMSPWIDVDNASAMTAGTLQYWNNASSVWTGCPTAPTNHWDTAGNYSNTSAVSSVGIVGQAPYNITFWDNHWCHNIDFAIPVITTKLRLTVTNTSYGEIPDSAGATFAHTIYTGHTFFQQFNISEILALSVTPQYETFPIKLH